MRPDPQDKMRYQFNLLSFSFCLLMVVLLQACIKGNWMSIGGKNGAVLKFKGQLIDQYDHPVPYGRVTVTYLVPGKSAQPVNGKYQDIRVEMKKIIFTDRNGNFEYDSSPVVQPAFYVSRKSTLSSDKDFYYPANPSVTIFEYKNGAWHHNYGTTDTVYKHDPEQVFKLHMEHTGPLSRMIEVGWRLIGKDDKSVESWLDISTGKWTSEPCASCDLHAKLFACPDSDYSDDPRKTKGERYQRYAMELEAREGGFASAQHNSHEAPRDGYISPIRIESYECGYWKGDHAPNESQHALYFKTRNGDIYGWLHYSTLQRLKRITHHEPNDWGGMGIIANPRRDRNLNKLGQNLLMPIQIPYQDEIRLNLDEVTAIEDSAAGTTTVQGVAGAASACRDIYIKNFNQELSDRDEDFEKFVKTNDDGSFAVTIKGSLHDATFLECRYKGACNPEKEMCNDPLLPVIQFARNNADSLK